VRPRFGAALAASVLQPLAEQLVADLDLTRSSVVCDLMCDSGVLTTALARSIGPFGTVVASDADLELATDVAESLIGVSRVVPRMEDGATVPLDDQSCDAVTSLLTVVFADHRFLLDDVRRVLRRGGRGTVMVWDDEQPPAFASALLDALREEGLVSPFLERMLEHVIVPRGAAERRIRDVCRAETAAHLWAAMLDGPLAVELAAVPEDTLHAVRARYESSLSPYESPDGTLRIPLRARLITLQRHGAFAVPDGSTTRP
jgi:ubiquinone/menaquinone biosynthesis C-methylase UbiE